MHDHGNEENFFDRLDFKPSSNGHDQPEFRLHAILVPDAEFVRCAERDGVVRAWSLSTTAGLGPNGQVVGSTDQRSKIRTFNIAPTWTRVLNPNTVFTFGGFARQDQYQLLSQPRSVRRPDSGSANQHHRPESQADEPGASQPAVDT